MSSSTRTTIRRFVAAVSVAGAVLAASGCSGAGIDAGAAAIVGDRRISVAELQTATTQINVLADPGGAAPERRLDQRTVLSFLVTGPYFVDAATRANVGVSQADAERLFEDFTYENPVTKKVTRFVDPLTGATTPSEAAVTAVRGVLARQNVLPRQDGSGPTEAQAVATLNDISKQLQATKVSVNPRYGTLEKVFDPQGQGVFPVNPSDPDWLVKSAAEPAATLPPAP
ncbi:hypothetical protein [Kineosporia sp. A_224]|uniref:hypothetical protein n=1 Tax=Kineosporia sp. A_224 TaxID=1962180 RepID=UPI000B4ACFBC|nr:hypothetical protein [Kineosporia sp. A_224]